ncbi:MerR family transcriptional regulator [Geobacter sp. DSM 9736]|uniref:MerR family transcriptional regulator n=1 Tax=Geobacter sp. DSM 9736 TaxID=1277350 RepID=UPI000B509312|nr:MerR family transcriptional regulator [Geobacter sp. DSM 9736]SNB45357.1 DNA-binding transcriptional regulator, MerR family [Geobacter sp. DSM 9736]
MAIGIPDKLFFKIGEVAELASLRPSVLRFWESEFPALKPNKSRTGQRLYSRKDVETVLEIKRLLYVEKLTIEGARKHLMSKKKAEPQDAHRVHAIISEVRQDLLSFRDLL